jgi:hypothetical protein
VVVATYTLNVCFWQAKFTSFFKYQHFFNRKRPVQGRADRKSDNRAHLPEAPANSLPAAIMAGIFLARALTWG